MGKNRSKMKGRRETGPFITIPKQVLNSSQYSTLSGWSVRLMIDLYCQYNGSNNGDFSCPWSMMSKKGWRSKGTLSAAIKQLMEMGFVIKTRQGGKNRVCLYAVTFRAIDECNGKLDVSHGAVALNTWKSVSVPSMSSNEPAMCTNK